MLRKILFIAAVALILAYFMALRACHKVPAAIGAPSEPQPLPIINYVQHPYLAESQRSSMHGGAHNWDINTYPGPLGANTITKHRKFSNLVGVAPNISFDSNGRLITVSIKLNSIELHLLDPETLETIAMLKLPPKASPSDNSGGGYFHIDSQDRVLLAPANDTIAIFEVDDTSGTPAWRLTEEYDIAGLLPEGVNILFHQFRFVVVKRTVGGLLGKARKISAIKHRHALTRIEDKWNTRSGELFRVLDHALTTIR